MKRILYVMHVAWGGIKQRPQFLAEELCKYFQVDVLYRKSNHYRDGVNTSFVNESLSVRGFRNLPFERFVFIPVETSHLINRWLWKFKHIDINSYDYIWVACPVLWWTIKKALTNKSTKLIYDCMDDNSAFPYVDSYPKYRNFYQKQEKLLLQSADIVFCSAQTLRDKLCQRYDIHRKINLLNNGITDNITHYPTHIDSVKLPPYSLVYIGTISEWFDFENTLRALNEFPELNIVLYGPNRFVNIPDHARLHFMGPTAHENLLAIMNNSCGLFMPFILNELIQSVNPVKLYEYIYSGKPILATKYSETEKFSEYVTLYSDYSEFRDFIRTNIFSEPSIDALKMRNFALKNTWKARAADIIDLLGI